MGEGRPFEGNHQGVSFQLPLALDCIPCGVDVGKEVDDIIEYRRRSRLGQLRGQRLGRRGLWLRRSRIALRLCRLFLVVGFSDLLVPPCM